MVDCNLIETSADYRNSAQNTLSITPTVMKNKKMNYYIQELERIKGICFSNKVQIDLAINTRRYIETNFAKEINLDLLAHLQFASKYHLIRVFKKYYGITPRQYLINKRIEEAKRILKSGKSVSDTCYAIGFESVNSFSNLFKAKTGMPPSVYRRATFDKSKI